MYLDTFTIRCLSLASSLRMLNEDPFTSYEVNTEHLYMAMMLANLGATNDIVVSIFFEELTTKPYGAKYAMMQAMDSPANPLRN